MVKGVGRLAWDLGDLEGNFWSSWPLMLRVLYRLLRGFENRDYIRFAILNEFLRILDGVLGFVFEELGFFHKQLPRVFSGAGCVEQRNASADKGPDRENLEAASCG